jgi:ornithine carbamoyltransferase
MRKDFVSVSKLTVTEIDELFSLSAHLKKELKDGKEHHLLKNKTLAMIFEKPSLRTRVTFETGMFQLGGHAIYLGPKDIQLGKRESIPDGARTFTHSTIIELGKNASIPVINALSDREHPCQIMADFFTILEHKGKLNGLKIAYVGDSNNVCNSIIFFCSIYGLNLRIASPKGYEPDPSILETADNIKNKAYEIVVVNEPKSAVKDADVIYTDVWASMGQENEKEKRLNVFRDFQINADLVSKAKKDVIVMHCLPAHRGKEITDEVIDGPHSVVLDEAENRLHTEKAILVKLLKG